MEDTTLDTTEPEGIEHLVFKVLVVGEPGVGKTSTVTRYVHGMFSSRYKSTIGVDFALKSIMWNERLRIDLQFWDLAGQERIGTQINVYFRDAMGALCVYDAAREETKAQIVAWKQLLNERVTNGGQHVEIPCVMIANKMDLVTPHTDFANETPREIVAMADQLGFVAGYGVSIKENIGLEPAIRCLVTEMLFRYRKIQNAIAVNNRVENLISLHDEQIIAPPPGGWCRC